MRMRWAYLLAVLPTLTEYLETGAIPRQRREFITDVVLTLVMLGFACIIKRQADRLARMALTDRLTGLFNRHKFEDDLRREVSRAERQSTALTLAYFDLDRFKRINDLNGHATGDAVLIEVGRALRSSVRREVDGCYRIGGDEFCVLMPQVIESEATLILERIAGGTAGGESLLLSRYGAGITMGVVSRTRGETPSELLRRADLLMYERKRSKLDPAGDAGVAEQSDAARR